jgi:hypothetical protein
MILDGRAPESLAQAAQALAAGELVGVPTETVYGLGARADDDAAVTKIFAAKGRPADHPLIVHVCDPAQAAAFASEMPEIASRLMAAFWPGPLTVIVPRAPQMAAALLEKQAKQSLEGLAVYSRSPMAGAELLVRRMPAEPKAAAHELFAVLRELDAAGAREIWIEAPPPGSAWDGVRDRLSRAAAAFAVG